jgi:hypothetical protein
MVKLKDGYVMNPREQAEYERVNALPRKVSGRVDYYFKPQTKYPPGIYVFMDAELWCDRNRRPMGLFNALPFLSRPMNREEIEYHHFNWRLCYHQYEDWDKLIYAEQQEADELDKENAGTGTAFLQKLQGFRQQFPLGTQARLQPVQEANEPESQESILLRSLFARGEDLKSKEVIDMLVAEQDGQKRLGILILLREFYQSMVSPDGKKGKPDLETVNRKVLLSKDRSRRNFVRRVYRKNKLFALEEIRTRYPDYEEVLLQKDLAVKSQKPKRKKHKPILDLRRCQLEKLTSLLRSGDLPELEYHSVCNRIGMLQNAHDRRLPIPLSVKLQGETLVYDFDWKTRENIVKSFVELANKQGMTHDLLKKRYQEITSSRNSF